MKRSPIPVFMYHSVGLPNAKWQWSELTIPYTLFESQLKFFKNNGYNTIHLAELYSYTINKKDLPAKTVVLTFDDGYADNYVFVFPLLKKYGLKGTVFVNPEFVDNRSTKRTKLYNAKNISDLDSYGFLSWEEMKEMEFEGTVDIQSHALTHTWYPISDKIIDFRHPNDKYIWMTWNDNTDRKQFLQFDNPDFIQFGEPVYENDKSLQARRYFPDKNIKKHLVEYVKKHGGEIFFNTPDWKSILLTQVELFKKNNKVTGYIETNEEWHARIRHELFISKKIIEEKLNKTIDFLCWPGGSGTKEGHRIAIELGYKMTTAARDIPDSTRKQIKNDGKVFADRIARTSPILIQKNKNGNVVPVFCNGFGLYLRTKAFSASGNMQRLYKLLIQILGFLRG